MMIKNLYCDVCKKLYGYPDGIEDHRHPELDIGGVPTNIWTPMYDLPRENRLQIDDNSKGISRFSKYLPSDIVRINSSECMTKTNIVEYSEHKILIKDEGENPTGSFKDRGMALLVGRCLYEGKKSIAVPSTGNAALSLSFYSGIADIKPIVFVSNDIPKEKLQNMRKCDIMISDNLVNAYEKFFEFCRKNHDVYNGFPANDIFYLQGLKTLAYEIYLFMSNDVPDWIFIPCGSGGNIVGQYHGFKDLENMGLSDKMPRFVSVQIEGADPITIGHLNGIDDTIVLENPVKSKANAIASDTCFNYRKIMNILQETRGTAVSVTDKEIEDSEIFSDYYEFSSRSVFAAFNKIKHCIKPTEKVLLIGTAKKRYS